MIFSRYKYLLPFMIALDKRQGNEKSSSLLAETDTVSSVKSFLGHVLSDASSDNIERPFIK